MSGISLSLAMSGRIKASPNTPLRLRVLVVDDSLIFLDRAARFLSSDPRVQVVAQASSATQALELMDKLQPNLVLMDLKMPGMNGLEATRRIKALPSAPQVIIATMYNDRAYRVAAQDVGADGFISKMDFSADLRFLINRLYPELRTHSKKETK